MKDNKLVDLIAAALTGIGLCWLDLSNHPTFLTALTFEDILQNASIRIGAFALVTLALFLWKHKLRAQWGWAVIAILGLVIVAGINEVVSRADDPEPGFFSDFSPFPMGVILYIVPALLFMGAAHYAGLLIVSRRRKDV
ncbi:MAG TPA: hypothetical protein VEY09_16265 [Pyrinomonadaceae bacterium]|nr:hypothetical protein [Pyrinomonadaceae bacterium]